MYWTCPVNKMADKLPTLDAYVTSERLRTERHEKSLLQKQLEITRTISNYSCRVLYLL